MVSTISTATFSLLCMFVSSCTADKHVDDFSQFIINEVNRDNIASNLKYLTSHPHVGGTEAEHETAKWVSETWKEQGLDEVHMTPYKVLLSYPDRESPNYARVINDMGDVTFTSQGKSPPLHSPEEGSEEVFPDFNAYSAPGNVSGDIVFANFGREEDFEKLSELGVEVSGRIVIAKYGEVFRANIADSADRRGALGLLLYSDPQQYAKAGNDSVYPDTVFMPGTAAAVGTTKLLDGDPLTPFYPAIESAFRLPESEAELPRIPIMPLGYNDARHILSLMGGDEVPSDWAGALDITYRLGPGLQQNGWKVAMEVNTRNKMADTYNVIGVIKGSEEPDRYIVLGNHRDAWIFGSVDPSSGTAAMMELSRIFMEYNKKTGWRPRRSIVFCSWGSEEYGLIGSVEWVEHFAKQLADRAVVYINIDMSIEGNYTLRTKAVPVLYKSTWDAAKLVPNPDPAEVAEGRPKVFDTWHLRKNDSLHPDRPAMQNVGSGSDYKAFLHNIGIPSVDLRYTHSKEMYSQPLYHTLYETNYLVEELYDKGFHFHAAITQMWGIMTIDFSDASLLPFSLAEYSEFIKESQANIIGEYGDLISGRNITMEHFSKAADEFEKSVTEFEINLANLNISDHLQVRRVNDQMMLIERAFIDNQGLPGRSEYNHVIMAPSASDAYTGAAFSGLTDALAGIEDLPEEEQNLRWRTFEQHLAACTHLILTAAKSLSDSLW